ncbi:MAG TPA: hypothetical protein VII51_07435 [Gaiellaceae bacterium]
MGSSLGATGLPLAPLSSLGHLLAPGPPGSIGPEGVPIPKAAQLAPADAPFPGSTVDGIKCQGSEQVLYHIHAHLTIYVDGKPRAVPYGIGIGPPIKVQPTAQGGFVVGGTCFAWLHTHARDGIVHIESPVPRVYTLGEFFDVWKQPLSRRQVGPAHGRVTALYDGKVYTGNPRGIPLLPHAQIQLEVGRPLVGQQTIARWYGL